MGTPLYSGSWTLFSGPVRSEKPLESGQHSDFTAFSALPQESESKIQNKNI